MKLRTRALFVLSALFLAACAGWAGMRAYVESEVRAGLNGLRPGLDVTFSVLTFDLFPRGVVLTGLTARTPEGPVLRAERARIEAFDLDHATPHFVRAAFIGLTVEDPAWGWMVPPCRAHVDYRYDPQSRELTVNRLSLDQPETFQADLSGRFGNLDLERVQDGQYFASSLAELELRYRDRSLLGRVLQRVAAQFQTSEAALRTRAALWLAAREAQARSRGEAASASALEALGRFARTPGELTVSLAPAEPVPFLYLIADGNLPQMLALLNARVEAR
ncbi:hypothetical protein [Desulfovibrio aminophilus]|uniref:hypothetical protein n=1 Tax=Desulfovibrio aminophilus TaxID=81425 RepID=UPI0004197D22|nr:hypothetical protein [Desulfovibrio aminophilus]